MVCFGLFAGLCLGSVGSAFGWLEAQESAGPSGLQPNGPANMPRLGLEALHINEALEEDAQSGVGFVRVQLRWSQIEPAYTDPANYSWSYYDSFFSSLSGYGIAPLALVSECPSWACGDPNGPIYDGKYSAFGEFMGAVAARYSHAPYNVHFYEFWNEPDGAGVPNQQLGWGLHPDKYAQMLAAAYPAIKGVDSQSVVMMGGLAYDVWFSQGGPFNPDFLPGVLDHGGAEHLDALAFHYYRNNAHGWTNIGLKAADVRAEMDAHGADLPLIVTESGLTSDPEYGSSEALQARYVVQMIAQGAASGLRAVTWYADRDTSNPNPGQEVFALSGLLRVDNNPKPSYGAMQTLSQEVGSGAYLYRLGAADGVVGALEGYRFRPADGTGQVSVVWNNSEGTTTMTIPASQAADLRRAVDLFGHEVATEPGAGGARLVSVGSDPVYLEWKSLFSDVIQGSTFYPYVMCLVGHDIISGYSDGTFRPQNEVTRGQVAKVVANAANLTGPVASQSFEDLPPGSTFYDFVGRLASQGYISGYACGGAGEPCVPPLNLPYFRPNASVTRGQISKIVSEAAGFGETPGPQQFEDVAPGSTFYQYIYRLASRAIMQGYACGGAGEPCRQPLNRPYFRPGNTATRGQASKIVANAFLPGCEP